MKTNVNYRRYLDGVNNYLHSSGFRVLTIEEEEIVLAHLKEVVRIYPEDDIGGLNLMETLVLEMGKKVCEIHPDLNLPTQERTTQAIESMLNV